jgi:lipopolysaccharide export system permease protein
MELDAKTSELRITDFREAASLISEGQEASLAQRPTRSLSTPRLWREGDNIKLGELAWRIGMGIAAINFIVLALAVSSVNPRASRSWNLVIALLSFVLYLNLINLGQSWVATGKVPWAGYLLGLHGSVLIASMLWLWKRHTGWSIKAALAGRREARA